MVRRFKYGLGKHVLHFPMNEEPHFGEMGFGEVGEPSRLQLTINGQQ